MSIHMEKEELKAVIKESVAEVFEQQKDYFVQLFGEVVEEQLFLAAMKDGEASGRVTREEVFAALRS